MLKKMRRRFILSAMVAVFAIVFLLSCSVVGITYKIASTILDGTIYGILDSELRHADPFHDGNFPDRGVFNPNSHEEPYMTRYFAVSIHEGQVIRLSRDYIATVSDEDAISYAKSVIAHGGEHGFYKGYRYCVWEMGAQTVVFLNAEKELYVIKIMVAGACGVSALCMLLAFGIIVILSRRAVDPYMRNMEQQKRFITDASHEIKTPLTSIVASADVLALDSGSNEWVENIQKQAQRLSKLVNSLVTLSRLDEEQPLPEQSDFSLSDVIWDVIEPVSTLAAAKGIEFTHSIADGLMMHGDSASISQLIGLLLDNAVKYTDERATMRLTAARQHRDIIIEVYNTCKLSEPESINRLFDRFYRPDESRASATGGTGIGLSIAKAIVDAHKGDISAATTDGTDITFRVKFKAV